MFGYSASITPQNHKPGHFVIYLLNHSQSEIWGQTEKLYHLREKFPTNPSPGNLTHLPKDAYPNVAHSMPVRVGKTPTYIYSRCTRRFAYNSMGLSVTSLYGKEWFTKIVSQKERGL